MYIYIYIYVYIYIYIYIYSSLISRKAGLELAGGPEVADLVQRLAAWRAGSESTRVRPSARLKICYTSRFVRVILAQGPC